MHYCYFVYLLHNSNFDFSNVIEAKMLLAIVMRHYYFHLTSRCIIFNLEVKKYTAEAENILSTVERSIFKETGYWQHVVMTRVSKESLRRRTKSWARGGINSAAMTRYRYSGDRTKNAHERNANTNTARSRRCKPSSVDRRRRLQWRRLSSLLVVGRPL